MTIQISGSTGISECSLPAATSIFCGRGLRAEISGRQPEFEADIAATARVARRLEPYWRAMYRKAAAVDVGFTRWIGQGI